MLSHKQANFLWIKSFKSKTLLMTLKQHWCCSNIQMEASSSQNVCRRYVAFGGFLCTRYSLLLDSLWSYSLFASLFRLFCLKNVRHQTAVSRQLTPCTTLIYHFDTYDTIFHSLAFPPLLLADCHQALWVGMRSKTKKRWRWRLQERVSDVFAGFTVLGS